MKKTYDALKALTLNFDIKVIIPEKVPVTPHVCNCAIDGEISEPCDGNCTCFNKTFGK